MSQPGRLLAILVLLLNGCSTLHIADKDDRWFAGDKYTHFLVSSAISAAITKSRIDQGLNRCVAARIGFGITLSIGAGKEIHDKYVKKTRYSYRDMTWDLLGSTVGSLAASNCH